MNKKICYVTTTSVSIDSFILPMFPQLEFYGFDVYFVTSCAEGFQSRCNSKIKIFDMPVGRGFDFIGTMKAAFKFYRICKKEKFDIVVYTTPNGALYGSIGSKMAKIPCRILAQWGMRYVGFDGFKRKIVCGIEKISCRFATDIRNVSEKNREIAIADKMYPPEKCKVLGKGGTIGVDLSLYKLENKEKFNHRIRERYTIPENGIVYGFVGRLTKDKGIAELLTAFSTLTQITDSVYLMLVGGEDVNAGIDQELLVQAHKNKKIVFCGQVPNAEVMMYVSSFDVLVHPTYREGFGMVLQEAAAMAVPTITTNIPGASEAIVDGVTGVLAEKQDVGTLALAMKKLLDPELRHRYGNAGRQRIVEDFERNMMIDRMCKDYCELYDLRCGNR